MTSQKVARFWSKVEVLGEDSCWPWKGAVCRNRAGNAYGNFDRMGAHRFSYMLANPGERLKVVRHSCDNPLCVNPKHLFNGTQKQNLDDMIQKGRSCRGEAVRTARLTEQDVRDVAAWYATGTVSVREIAEKYGMDKYPIQRIVRGNGWRHVDRTDTSTALAARNQRGAAKRRGEDNRTSKLTAEQVREIRTMWAEGGTIGWMARWVGVNRCTVADIVYGRTWRHLDAGQPQRRTQPAAEVGG